MIVSRHFSSVLINWIACVSRKKSMEITTGTRLELVTGPYSQISPGTVPSLKKRTIPTSITVIHLMFLRDDTSIKIY